MFRYSLINFIIDWDGVSWIVIGKYTSKLDRYLSATLVEVHSSEDDFDILGYEKQFGTLIFLVLAAWLEIYLLYKFQP